MSGRLLVTGAAGFIGSHACHAFLHKGWQVAGIDNFDPFYDRRMKEEGIAGLRNHKGFRFTEGDIRDVGVLEPAMRGADVVLHLAALAGVQPSIDDPESYVSVNVGGTAALLEVCRTVGVRRVVFGSSSSVYGDAARVPFSEEDPAVAPISPYAATKRAGELQCAVYTHLYDFRVAVLRFFTVYGHRQRPDLAIHKFTRLISTDQTIRQLGDGSSERDYTHVDDIVAGVMAAVDWTRQEGPVCEIINLGESTRVRLSYLIELIGHALHREPRVQVCPPAPGDVYRTCADISKAKRLLAYDPQITIEDGIPQFVDWYRTAYGHAA